MKKLKIFVKEVQGYCDIMREGDHFLIDGSKLIIPNSSYFCYWALNSVLPMIPVKQREILKDPNDWMPGTWEIQCPDPNGKVILKIQPL
jgi:uncharacterized repeat protein (TIGR04076 family)